MPQLADRRVMEGQPLTSLGSERLVIAALYRPAVTTTVALGSRVLAQPSAGQRARLWLLTPPADSAAALPCAGSWGGRGLDHVGVGMLSQHVGDLFCPARRFGCCDQDAAAGIAGEPVHAASVSDEFLPHVSPHFRAHRPGSGGSASGLLVPREASA